MGEEDIPGWKKAMLERRKKDKEEEEAKTRNFGFIPGTTLHSSYVNKSYDQDQRLTSWGSASNLRTSSSYTNLTEEEPTPTYRKREYTPSSTSSWSKTAEKEPELTPYEKYLKRKKEQEEKDEEEKRKAEETKREEERKRERERRREEERRKEEEAEREKARQREKERERKRLEEEKKEKEEKEKAEKAKSTTRAGVNTI